MHRAKQTNQSGPKMNRKQLVQFFLRDAAIEGDLEEARRSAAAGGNVNGRFMGYPLLHLAVMYGHRDVAELLIRKGAKPNARDEHGQTPLHWAALTGNLRVFKMLLDHDTHLNSKDESGRTALHIAAVEGRERMVECLLSAGADPNRRDEQGNTPLYYADPEQDSLVGLMLEHGARE